MISRWKHIGLAASMLCAFALPLFVTAQTVVPETETVPSTPVEQTEAYVRAKVVSILEEGEKDTDGEKQPYQKVSLEILHGPEKGKRVVVDHGDSFVIQGFKKVKIGEKIVLAKPANAARDDIYYIADQYRGTNLILVVLFFFALAILLGRKRGVMAILGMIFSALVIFYFIAPRILQGSNPFLLSVIGGSFILIFSLYLSHGFNKRTSVALAGSLITLGFAVIINLIFVSVTYLSGSGSEEAFYLQGELKNIDLKGLLLGGIIIGVLGVLDDITTAQVASVEEVAKANPRLTFKELYQSGLSVGREHIASLVNTLVLAYVGVSFPLILLYSMRENLPLWMLLNSNFIAEEIVRTVVGSSALIIAVPISTALAAYIFQGKRAVSVELTPLPSREERVRRLWGKDEKA